ncbi:TonB-dependent receptor [Parapedobacter tibetensis]|uniref:TonB-dependent receptor n=1 Tax=Parapedobacter tibetensis TaxID=2972951 RepID=UPI00214DEC32|nr:TonB-dependent receptor [Parapedobacter tibetensis]
MIKLSCALLLIGCYTTTASVYSQSAKVNLHFQHTSIAKVMEAIEQKTTYKFVYRSNDRPFQKKISIAVNNKPVAEVLNQILDGTGYEYELIDHETITLRPLGTVVNQRRISGYVTDEAGHPLPGVTVMLKGNNRYSTATDENGHFGLTIDEQTDPVLTFHYMGYEPVEIVPDASNSIRVSLKAASGTLDEVIVLGYSAQKKQHITGSVSTISSKEVLQSPTANVSNALVGRLPGLMAVQGSGQPGRDDSQLYIRGVSTTGNSSPLVVVDGIPVEPGVNTGSGERIESARLPHLNPNDIANISVLKDAATAAVYGARAANGVILITTKRGQQGKTSLQYSHNSSLLQPTLLTDLVDSYTYATLENELYQNEARFDPTQGRGYTAEQLEIIRTGSNPDRYANTDWYEELNKTITYQQRHNLSVNGGSDRSRYFISGGYLDQQGQFPSNGYKEYSLRTNLDADITSNLRVSLNLNGRIEKTKDQIAGSNISGYYRQISPLIPSRFSNGYYNYVTIPSGFTTLVNGSPYLITREGGYNNTDLNSIESIGTIVYDFPFAPGLSAKGTFSYNKYTTYIKYFAKPYTSYIRNEDGTYSSRVTGQNKAWLTETFRQGQTVLAEASLRYNRSFGNHQVNGLVLYTQTRNTGNNFRGGRSNFPSAQIDQLFAGDPTTAVASGGAFEDARQSMVGQFGYNFRQKYLFDFSFRYDGSDVFPDGGRFGFFPSLSGAWVLSEEHFLKDHSHIDFLKIRGSWGQMGNDRVGRRFDYLNNYTLGTGLNSYYIFGEEYQQALVPGVIPNTTFTWEKASLTNIGLEAQFFDNLLGLEADYFYKRTRDILASRSFSIPATIGGTLPSENLSIVDNQGFELALTHQNTVGNVQYSIRPNFTYNKNKVIYMPEPAATLAYQSNIGQPVRVGQINIPSIGYVADGLYQSQEEIDAGPTPLLNNVAPGDIRYVDINGDGEITADDRVLIGKGNYPTFIYGLNLGLNYKNFELNALLQGAGGIEKYMGGISQWAFAGNSVPTTDHLDRWTPDNPSASYPRLFKENTNNQQISNYWVRDASYLRLKNVEIAYHVPSHILQKAKINGLRIYLSGTNLFTLTNIKNADPEAVMSSFGSSTYLVQKLYNVGLNLSF